MSEIPKNFIPKIPQLNLSDGVDMLKDFSREAQRHLGTARDSLLVIERVPTDKMAMENIFKTFHTIKGLSDFLELQDISILSSEAEGLMDMIRKGQMPFDPHIHTVTSGAIDDLEKLLHLLDEQLTNNGALKGPYHDISGTVNMIQSLLIRQEAPIKRLIKDKMSVLPTIHLDLAVGENVEIEKALQSASANVHVPKISLQKLSNDLNETQQRLQELQSKLLERQRELTQEKEQAIILSQRAQAEAKSKSEYLARTSHEIRTIINAILGFTDLMRESNLNERQRKHLETILTCGKMLLDIVNDILDFSRVESGKLKLEEIDFPLESIIEDVFKIIRTRLMGKPVDLYFHIHDDLPRFLKGDPTRLKQIFINLLDNAMKFTEKGSIGLTAGRIISQGARDSRIVLRVDVEDTGIGIPQDRTHLIFETFTQVDPSTTRLYGGTGLGLALCKSLVETMGGRIWVESQLGKGSQFHLEIPLKEGAVHSAPPSEEKLSGLKGAKVMVVDAQGRIAQKISAFCRETGMTVFPSAANAKQASELLSQKERSSNSLPTVLFIDVMLPEKEGFMLAYKIRQQECYRALRLVAVSSDVKADTSEGFHEAGFDAFLATPIIRGELRDLFHSLLGGDVQERRILPEEQIDKISCEGIRVLIVEDSLPNQELLQVHFETLGCSCDYAGNGEEAIKKLATEVYDIIFMDLQMPVMGGLEATRIIRQKLHLTVPIVALTAAEIHEEMQHCFLSGMNDYLAKPFDLQQLKRKLIRCTRM
jgi:signal transduction histidine kinase/DNA-binding response OmpR family regulator